MTKKTLKLTKFKTNVDGEVTPNSSWPVATDATIEVKQTYDHISVLHYQGPRLTMSVRRDQFSRGVVILNQESQLNNSSPIEIEGMIESGDGVSDVLIPKGNSESDGVFIVFV